MKLRTIMALICAVLFNVVAGSAIAYATGIPAWGIIAGGGALSMLIPSVSGAGMAVQKEIWMTTIVEGLFADNSFVSKAVNADGFVNQGKSVHIPNAGAPSGVEKNRKQFPAQVNVREDMDLKFDLDEYTTNPIRIPHADTVELSYNKRESVIRQDRSKLIETVADDFTYRWAPSSAKAVKTTGKAVVARIPNATGYRKALTTNDIEAVMTQFNAQNIPQEGRYALLDAYMYSELLNSMTAKESEAFYAHADLKNGVVGKLFSFNIMMRSKALRYNAAGAPMEWKTTGSADDNSAALMWWENAVCRALGEVNMFDNEGNPVYYGDIYSFLVRAGGRPMRQGVEGLTAIIQDTAEAPVEAPVETEGE